MMRVRLPMGRSVFFLCALLAALLALFPLRLALDWLDWGEQGLSAREVRGSVWLGTLAEARFGDAPLGDLTARLRLLPLVAGRARVDLAGEGIEGAVSVARHDFGLDDVTARVPLGQRLAPLPVVAVDLRDLSVRFRDGLCERAEGLVKASIEGAPAGIALPGGLSGNARCEEGALLLPLVSQSGMESVLLQVRAGGAYRAELAVRPGSAAVRDALLGSGFAPGAGGFVLTATGTL